MSPPTAMIDGAGWVVLAAFVVGCVATARRLLDESRQVTFNQLLAISYAGVAGGAGLGGVGRGPPADLGAFLPLPGSRGGGGPPPPGGGFPLPGVGGGR